MRVALVNPPMLKLIDPYLYPPTGLYYLEAAIKAARPKIEVEVVNVAGEPHPKLDGYDVLAWSVVSAYWDNTVEVASRFDATQIVGGPHVSGIGKLPAGTPFKAACLGQGETAIVRMLDDIEKDRLRRIYLPSKVAIDSIPIPDPMLGGKLKANGARKEAVVLTSRGCTNRCAFCAARRTFPCAQLRSAENVLKELNVLRESGIRDFRFLDDLFALGGKRAFDICKKIEGAAFRWSCHTRVDCVTPKLLAAMKRSGCKEIGFGVESFDQSVLDACQKRVTVKQNLDAIAMAADEGLRCDVYLLVGTPGERGRTVDLNICAMERLKDNVNRVQFSTLMPFPGSPIWERPGRFGVEILDRDFNKYTQHQFYRAEDGGIREYPCWSPLKIRGMSEKVQYDNMGRMRDYIKGLKQYKKDRIPDA